MVFEPQALFSVLVVCLCVTTPSEKKIPRENESTDCESLQTGKKEQKIEIAGVKQSGFRPLNGTS